MYYDYLVVGAGLFGSVFAHEKTRQGYKCLVIDRRDHIGGNIYTKEIDGIQVHQYGAHIFHTSDKAIWKYIQQFAEFNHFINSPLAVYRDEQYNLPFNMNTFSKLWGIKAPEEAKQKIREQIAGLHLSLPAKNLEEQALLLVGTDIYEKLIRGYTQKQWGRECRELPSFIIKRLPLRFIYDNNYFNDPYQGIPIGGYTEMVRKMLNGTEVWLRTNFSELGAVYQSIMKSYTGKLPNGKEICFGKIIYSGPIDEYYHFCYGPLAYRTLRFETEKLSIENFQGNAVVNYTDEKIPYTRIIEHKHFEFGQQPTTIISREYPAEWHMGMEAYYPINDEENTKKYQMYKEKASHDKQIVFGGRLGQYRYFDMDRVIKAALECVEQE